MKFIMKGKNKVIFILLGIIIISGMSIYGKRLFFDEIRGRVVSKVSFNFDGVDEGLNPQGGTFDAQNIKNKIVLQMALDQLGWESEKVDANTLSRNMMVSGIVPKDVMGRIMPNASLKKDMQLEKVGGISYHPTQYAVTLTLNKDIKLTKKEAKLLVDTIIESYSEYFVQRYKDTQAIETAIVPIDPERYDYSEYIDLTMGQLEIIKSYLSSKEQVAKDFRSSTTYLSFGDLIAQVDLIEDVEVGNVKALLDSFVITKNSKESAVVYENMIHRMKREGQKYKQEAQILKNIANNYEKDKTIIMGNGALPLPQDEEKAEEVLYDQLVQQAAEVDSKANRLNKQVQYYESLLANLKEQNEVGINGNIEPYIEEVEQSIVYISHQMKETMAKIKETVDDYYEQEVFEESIVPVMRANYQSSFRVHLIKDTVIFAGVTFVMLLVGLIYLLGRKEVK